jgi:hypothetical protein
MCIGDWRLGRLIASEYTVVAPGTSRTFSANQSRVGIHFIASFASLTNMTTGSWVESGTITVDGNGVIRLVSVAPSVKFTLDSDGNTPTKSFVVNAGGMAITGILVIEYFLSEKILSEQLESLYAKPFGGYTP